MRTASPIFGSAWGSGALVFVGALVLWAALWVVSLVADDTRIPAALSESARDTSVLVCKDGIVDHESGSLLDRLFGSNGQFRCTDWHTRDTRLRPSGTVDWPSSPRR